MNIPGPENNIEALNDSIEMGISYLHEHQLPNGEFCCYYAPDDKMTEWCVPDSTVFPTALISSCLLQLRETPKVAQLLLLASNFLSYQIMRGGVWNFFTKWNPLFKLSPPDADDTVFASWVLKSLGVEFEDNISLLLSNRDHKGLFYTWFVLRPKINTSIRRWKVMARELKRPFSSLLFWSKYESERNDIDGVVNANILFYLGLNQHTKPVVTYLLDIIAQNKEKECDKWYKNPFTFYYFLARNYPAVPELEPAKASIVDRILSTGKTDGSLGNSALDTALALSVLMNFNYRDQPVVDQAAHFLISAQRKPGNWERNIFFYSGPSKTVGWGSEEIVTAYCIEALADYRKLQNEAPDVI
ncbi:hypothetical protein [Pedobacter cryoconitis]|uniref:Uncharacterized protein n=1 Tax=Pedobacter cryoconitis TaxID=188932 RepID=A0A7X0IZ34_9SPHI|nr:hypothetical protein [Pedobacter cryoconitis]MBB6498115.1 hypothetical protein [Pedobacter cryoconitis]